MSSSQRKGSLPLSLPKRKFWSLLLSFFLLLASFASARELIGLIWTANESRCLLFQRLIDGQFGEFQPIVFVHADFIDRNGVITGESVNLRKGTFPTSGKYNEVHRVAHRGQKLNIIGRQDEWVVATVEESLDGDLPSLREPNVRSFNTVQYSTTGLSSDIYLKLLNLRGDNNRELPFLCLPTYRPSGYQATLESLESREGRGIGPGFLVLYKKDDSWFSICQQPAGGDTWYTSSPPVSVVAKSQNLGVLEAALMSPETTHIGGPLIEKGYWVTDCIALPGAVTKMGDMENSVALPCTWTLTFSKDIPQDEIRKILSSVRFVEK